MAAHRLRTRPAALLPLDPRTWKRGLRRALSLLPAFLHQPVSSAAGTTRSDAADRGTWSAHRAAEPKVSAPVPRRGLHAVSHRRSASEIRAIGMPESR